MVGTLNTVIWNGKTFKTGVYTVEAWDGGCSPLPPPLGGYPAINRIFRLFITSNNCKVVSLKIKIN